MGDKLNEEEKAFRDEMYEACEHVMHRHRDKVTKKGYMTVIAIVGINIIRTTMEVVLKTAGKKKVKEYRAIVISEIERGIGL